MPDAGIRDADRAAVSAARGRVRVTDPVDPDAVHRDRADRARTRTKSYSTNFVGHPFMGCLVLFDRERFVKFAVAHEPQRFVDTDGGIVVGADVESDRLDAVQLP